MIDNAKKCSKCGKLVSHISSREGICFDCVQKRKRDYAIYSKIRAYVKENPNCLASEVVVKFNTSLEKIQEFINEGLLEVTKDPFNNENKGSDTNKAKEDFAINTNQIAHNPISVTDKQVSKNKTVTGNPFEFKAK